LYILFNKAVYMLCRDYRYTQSYHWHSATNPHSHPIYKAENPCVCPCVCLWAYEFFLNGTSAQLGYKVPFSAPNSCHTSFNERSQYHWGADCRSSQLWIASVLQWTIRTTGSYHLDG